MKWTVFVLWTVASVVRADALSDQVAEYKKAGEPIEMADFRAAAIPDADNGAPALKTAVDLFRDQSPAWRKYDAMNDVAPPLSDGEVAALRAVVAETRGTVIPHIDVAMTRKGVVWPIKMESPCLQTLLLHLNGMRGLANLLRAHALLHHHEGNDAEALRDVRRIVFISRASDRQPFIVGHLVSCGVMSLAVDTVERIAPDLKVGADPGAASPQQVKELTAELLDDAPSRTGEREALFGERMSHLDAAECLINGKLTPASFGRMLGRQPGGAMPATISKEAAAADAILLMRHSTEVIRAFEASFDWPTYKTRDPGRPKDLPANSKQHPLATILFSPLNRATEIHFRVATDRRLAAVALAARAYATAHDGKLPSALNDLVPASLPSVPDDPMAAAQPLQYQPDPAQPIVYSVGTNGTDDAGSEGADAKTAGRWQQNDAVMHLSRVPRTPGKQP